MTDRVPAIDLRPPGDAGSYIVAARLFRRIEGQVFHHQGPGADETHIPPDHIEQLRKLIEAEAPKHLPQRCQADVIRQQVAFFIFPVIHRAKFVNCKKFSMKSGANLSEQYGTPHSDPDKQSQAGKQRQKQYEENHSENKVKNSFHGAPTSTESHYLHH
jgi:hypothetical protein